MRHEEEEFVGVLLSGFEVVQTASSVSAAFCAQLLADLGARVRLAGGPPWPVDAPPAYREALRLTVQRGVVPVADVQAALRDADVVITDRHPEQLPDLGDGALAERAVVVAITPFGLTGPRSHWQATELVACAYGGGCQQNGEPGRAPLGPPPFVADFEVGVTAAVGTLIALLGATRDGVGQVVDVSAACSWATVQTALGLLEFLFQGRVAQRAGRQFHGRPYPYTILPTADGEARLICLTGHEWRRALKMMGDPAWGHDPRYADRVRIAEELHDEVDGLVGQWLRERTGDEILTLAMDEKVPWAPLRTIADVLEEQQLHGRAFFQEHEGVRVPGLPSRFRRAGGDKPPRVAAPARTGAPQAARAPLEGLRVLDLGWSWAGATIGSFLGDFGADVVKIESRAKLDPMRMDRPLIGDEPDIEQGGLHHNVNRNKRSVAVDLSTERGRELVRQLVADADVLIENFSPGVLDRMGLGYDDLSKEHPGLVYLSLGAVGRGGPLAGLRAYAPVVTAMSGLDALVGYPGERPVGLQHGLADPNAGLHGTVAVLAALIERQRTGEGLHVDFSQLESMVALLAPHLVAYQLSGELPRPQGNRHPLYAPQGVYPAAGEDHWVAVSCPDTAAWHALRSVLGDPDWAQAPELDTLAGRVAAHDRIDAAIAEWTSGLDRWAVADTLQAAGVPAAPLLDTGDRFADDHFQAREAFVPVEHPVVGTEFVYGPPWKLSRTPGRVSRPTPLLGQHTAEILGASLGLDADAVARLVDEGVLR